MHQTHKRLGWLGRLIPALLLAVCFLQSSDLTVAAEPVFVTPNDNDKLAFKLVPQTTIRISVVEWLAADGEYKEWDAVGGEYIVDTDGTISVPLVGTISALGLSASQMASSLSEALQSNTGLAEAPAVSAQIVSYPPVYVTGDVQSPGEIAYRPGMTVMQAVALAGGRDRAPETNDRWAKLDQIRQSGEINRFDLQFVQQMARKSRLQAELAGEDKITFSPEFETLANSAIKNQIKETETILFVARKESFERQIASLEDLRELLTNEIEVLEDQMAVQDSQIEVATEELRSVTKLFDNGVVTKSRQTTLGRLVADLQRTKMNMIIAIMRARQNTAETTRDIVALRAERQTDLGQQLQDTINTMEDLTVRRGTARQMMQANGFLSLENENRADLDNLPLEFSVVRESENSTILDVSAADLLFPGDLLEVRMAIEVPLDSVVSSAVNE